jgi:small-conductance mechanosensitive channel/CRP-like cAMP-binding protein
MSFYLEAVIFLAAMACALALYVFFRMIIDRGLTSREKASGIFLARLILPVVLVAATLAFKLRVVRGLFSFGHGFDLFLNAALVFFIFFLIIRLINSAVLAWYGRRRRPFPLPRVLHGLLLAVLYLIVLFSVFKNILGINITPFLTTSAILTMILGLALQGVLSNILAGMSLHFTKSFKQGDWIKVGENEGVVMDTTWRETRLIDRNSNIIIVPNNMMASEKVTNFSLPDKKTALNYIVRAGSEAPPAAVQEALLEAARDVPEVLVSPAPQAHIRGTDDLGVSYALKFWVSDFGQKDIILTKVGRLVWYKLRRRNISIPLPLQESLTRLVGAVGQKEVEPAAERPAGANFRDLLNSSFLRRQEGPTAAGRLLVSAREIRELAGRVKRGKYSAGEVLFRQGEKGETCYLVCQGLVRGEVVYEEKGKRYISEFKTGPGGIAGEMSLFTGLPRTATCSVDKESELLKIRAADFAALLAGNRDLAGAIAGMVSERNRKNQEFLAKIKELSEQDVAASCSKKSILAYLKKFVRLFRTESAGPSGT